MTRQTLLAVALALASAAQAADLAAHRWRERVLLVHVTHAKQAVWQRFEQSLREQSQALRERDLVVYVLRDAHGIWRNGAPMSQADAEALRRHIDLAPGMLQLIGTDGGVKLTQPLAQADLERIHRTIDAMPMRQWEMQNRR
ncbi:MAG: DUF4174 domain-containing protein [Thiobacillaceae bacterium]